MCQLIALKNEQRCLFELCRKQNFCSTESFTFSELEQKVRNAKFSMERKFMKISILEEQKWNFSKILGREPPASRGVCLPTQAVNQLSPWGVVQPSWLGTKATHEPGS